MHTFKVDNVKVGELPSFQGLESADNFDQLMGFGVEASSSSQIATYPTNNLLGAVNIAYDCHLPLQLSPDMIWLTIAQGLAQHINNNAEELRSQFVQHEGKENLVVFENNFVKGNANNDWQHMFGEFSKQIKERIGKKHDLIVGNYSTTGVVERAANEIVLMDAMQSYFSYECVTCCGIPEITVLGTREDWLDIKSKVAAISEFGLSWWTDKVLLIIDEFVAAVSENPRRAFWQSIFKIGGGSGGPYLSGWITHLFPYTKNRRDNTYTLPNKFSGEGMFGGVTTDSFPLGVSQVPFIWTYYDQKFDMGLSAGFTGLNYVEGRIVPAIGWAVRDMQSFVQIEIIPLIERDNDTYYQQLGDIHDKILPQIKSELEFVIQQSYPAIKGMLPRTNLAKLQEMTNIKVTVMS